MYNNAQTQKGVNKVLAIFFIIFVIVVIGALAMAVLSRIDGDTMTVTKKSDDQEECLNEDAQQAAKNAGIKVPVKCKKKSQ